MTEKASRLTRIREAVKLLNVHLQNREVATKEYFAGMEALFELLDQPWESDVDPAWLEGYEQCMLDFVDALADEWHLPIWSQIELMEEA